MDVHDSKTRSYNMSCIKGKRTIPEEIVARYLFSQGFRYRRHVFATDVMSEVFPEPRTSC